MASLRDPIKKFETVILWPMSLILIGGTVLFALHARLLWAIGGGVALVYLGTVRAGLRKGERGGAVKTNTLAALEDQNLQVRRACTRVGGLAGVMIAEVLFKGLDWDWYPSMVVGLVTLLVVGALLKLICASQGLSSDNA